MRADRLVAALLVLQARTRVTAKSLAEELEVSERTARRDLEALAMAGVPVYSQPGRYGGWSLVGGARTDLSGLTEAEVRTLFLVAGPSAATPEMKRALRKLVRALPETFRPEAEAAASAVVVDPTGWDHHRISAPVHLEALQKAVIDGVQVVIRYAGRDRRESERTVHPLGLVDKNGVWYLVANTGAGMRTFRVSRVRSVGVTAEPVERPEGFELEEAWRATVESLDESRVPLLARIRTTADLVPVLRFVMQSPIEVTTGPGTDGVVELAVRARDAQQLAWEVAGFSDRLEVLEPDEVRVHLGAIADGLARLYR